MTRLNDAIKDRDNAWQRYYEMERKRDAVLAAVRSVFGLDEDYADKVIESVTQPNISGGYMITRGSHRVSGLPRLEADLLAASDSKRATEALARLTKPKVTVSTSLAGTSIPVKAVKRAVKRTVAQAKTATA